MILLGIVCFKKCLILSLIKYGKFFNKSVFICHYIDDYKPLMMRVYYSDT